MAYGKLLNIRLRGIAFASGLDNLVLLLDNRHLDLRAKKNP